MEGKPEIAQAYRSVSRARHWTALRLPLWPFRSEQKGTLQQSSARLVDSTSGAGQ